MDDIEIDGHRLRTSISVGIAIYPTDGDDMTTLLRNADAALYRAKREGHNVVRFFDSEMATRLRERRMLKQELKTAVTAREFMLYYQPQVGISGEVVGFEALARWQHPTRGLVLPDTFIPLMEENGLIVPIGEWILREACRQAACWSRPLHVAVNLSPIQFRRDDLAHLVLSILLETGLSPHRLELEITEGVLIDDFSRALSILRNLKALGVGIVMDDFGSGYSSLSYLQSFPFSKVKIDKTFISSLGHNADSATIVRAAIALAHGLGLTVMAEGVETPEQRALLIAEKCDQIQGFLTGRPRMIEDYAELTQSSSMPRARLALAG
jgi:EAL domain-containing protein (putative c-di-GMP-specific phosphodiesterase class I)